MKENILVTGASGFVGKELCLRLDQLGYSVIPMSSKDGDISDIETFSSFKDQKIKHIFHLAGNTFVPKSWDAPHYFIKTNVLGTSSVLDFCAKNGCSLTYVSAYIYGNKVINPISENAISEPNNPYALSKKMAEDLCEFYSKHMNVNVTVVRPFNVYGPGQREDFLLPFIIKQINESKEVKVKDLEPKRDYIHVRDLAECLIKAMDHKTFEVFNAGFGKSYSVKEIIEIALKIKNKTMPILSEQTARVNEISDTVADISKAKRLLKWIPQIDIETGIKTLFS